MQRLRLSCNWALYSPFSSSKLTALSVTLPQPAMMLSTPSGSSISPLYRHFSSTCCSRLRKLSGLLCPSQAYRVE